MKTEILNNLCKNSLISNLGIEFTYVSEDKIEAIMPVDERTIQPFKYLHGGAMLALAETLASAGSVVALNDERYSDFGVSVSAKHMNSVKEGIVKGTAIILKQGKTLHTWEVKIYDTKGTLLSSSLVTNAVVENKQE